MSTSVLQDLFSGSVAGGAGMILGHPLDTMKVRMQANPAEFPTLMKSFKKTLSNEGMRGLFKGLAPPLGSIAIYQAVCFASFSPALAMLTPKPAAQSTPNHLFLAGCASGLATVAVTTPTDLLKIRMQTETAKGAKGGMGEIKRMLLNIIRSGGLTGLYKGASATAIRDTWSTGLYFVVYHKFSRRGKEGGYNEDLVELIAGGVAGMTAWGLCLPADVVKTRFQASSGAASWLGTLSSIIKSEGYGALFTGAAPLLSRAFIVNAVTFWTYEKVNKKLNDNRN
ncbi:hypothetical protein TrLO_g5060 [Triparma laevis f. longispina]|uniref:Mitochondrial carrier n=1 Tax=Triparma laevis f. longispina TaxID=1714387 RepID=A0A9W7DNB6_9STRA|nr:hypothetical protein TrLO_g5060 [Triparma laevis f. longispina]